MIYGNNQDSLSNIQKFSFWQNKLTWWIRSPNNTFQLLKHVKSLVPVKGRKLLSSNDLHFLVYTSLPLSPLLGALCSHSTQMSRDWSATTVHKHSFLDSISCRPPDNFSHKAISGPTRGGKHNAHYHKILQKHLMNELEMLTLMSLRTCNLGELSSMSRSRFHHWALCVESSKYTN